MKIKKVKEFMTTRLITINRATTIKEIARIFLTHSFDFLPVVDKENHLLGVITKKDILAPFLPEYFNLLEDINFISDFGSLEISITESLEHLLLAEDIMVKNPVTVDEETSLFKAIALISHYKVRHLPVVKEGKLVGIVSRTDILRALFSEEK